MTEIAARLVRPIQRLGRFSLVGVALAIALAVAGGLMIARAVALQDAVLPGVRVAGVEVGGLSRSEAEARIVASLSKRLSGPIEVTVEGESFALTPSAIFQVDSRATVDEAYERARTSFADRVAALSVPFLVAHDVQPVLDLRSSGRDALTRRLLALTERPVNARVTMRSGEPVVVPGREGTQVEEVALLAVIRAAALTGVTQVDARVVQVEPALTTTEAERAATVARTAAAAPVRVAFGRKELGVLDTETLVSLVRFRPVAGDYEVVLDTQGLTKQVGPLVRPHTRKPKDADFRLVGARVRVVRARQGLTLDVEQARSAVLAAATGPGVRVAEVELAKVAADFTTREAKALGIRHRVSTFTTDMGVSSANRIWNVQLLGRYLDGTIIKPGKWFSYNKVMGPRTVERGFREGHAIFGGVLIPSIGGGVCQTATTIFNAAFEAGLPVKERHNHSFYISHYPTGRDATVSWGGPDLVFRNDLDHAILIKVAYTSSTFTVSFFGTKQKRRVVATTSSPANHTQPRLQYAIDPNAPPNSVHTTAAGGPGFDVNVHRKVYERGKLLRQDDFFTRYVPQHPTAVYGPGRTPPGPYFYLPSSA